MSYIVVCPLSQLAATARLHQPRDLITLLSPKITMQRPPMIAAERHLQLTLNDIAAPTPGLLAPMQQDVAKIIDKAQSWNRQAPLLIHCWMGVSRSTAAAFTILCVLMPHCDEHKLAQQLRAKSPFATPNQRIIELADYMLNRNGRMIDAIKSIGLGQGEGLPFRLEIEDYPC